MSTRVVVVGGGFAGLLAARNLKGGELDVTLVDRQNFFLFNLSPTRSRPARCRRSRWPRRSARCSAATGERTSCWGRSPVSTSTDAVWSSRTCRTARSVGSSRTTCSSRRAGRATVLRPRRLEALCAGAEVARGRPRPARPHPLRLRGGGARAGACPADRLPDLRRRRRRADRSRDGGADRRARASRPAQRVPGDGHGRGDRLPRRGRAASSSRLLAEALPQRRAAAPVARCDADARLDGRRRRRRLRRGRAEGSRPAPDRDAHRRLGGRCPCLTARRRARRCGRAGPTAPGGSRWSRT